MRKKKWVQMMALLLLASSMLVSVKMSLTVEASTAKVAI
jgi:hypothetical protein